MIKDRYKIYTYLDFLNDIPKYSYIIDWESNDEYISSMPLYESAEEAKIAATLLLERLK